MHYDGVLSLTEGPGIPWRPACPRRPFMPLSPFSPATPFSPRVPAGPYNTHSQLHYVARIGYNVNADTKTIYAMDVEQSKLFSVLFLCLYGFIVLTAAPLAPADPTGPEGPPGPYRQGKTRMSEASR